MNRTEYIHRRRFTLCRWHRALCLACLFVLCLRLYASHPIGTPFFRNYPAKVYNAHNRNFDLMCDDGGYLYVANFEGLLIYDNVKWRIVHTPGISRVMSLSKDKQGRIWFSGINVEGCVESVDGDSVRVRYTKSDENAGHTRPMGVAGSDSIDRWNGLEVHSRLRLSADRTLLATASAGVVAIDAEGNKVWEINEDKGLCSNSVNKLAYDGMGTVWGVTDNGLFSISISELYTYFSTNEGLHGQVTCIAEAENRLFVGTLQGLFYLKGDRFEKLEGMDQACWQLTETVKRSVLAATTNGVFTYGHAVHRKSDKMSLSVLVEDVDTYLSGELDGIYRRDYDGGGQLVDSIPNVIKMRKDKDGGIEALTLGGEHYYMAAGAAHFTRQKGGKLSQLLEYTDDKGYLWHCHDDGMGVMLDGMPDNMSVWLRPFSSYSIQAMYVNDGIIWIGGNFGLIRFDLDGSMAQKPLKPQVYVRSFVQEGRNLYASMANDKLNEIGKTLYSFRLHSNDKWSKWSDDQDVDLHNMGYGGYEFTVRSMDPYGQISESAPREFTIPYPLYMRWYALLLYAILTAILLMLLFRYRTRMLKKRQEELEAVVAERTQEVVSQKDEIEKQKDEIELQKNEIEEKSNRLEMTLEELRETQDELVRKEREATVGKLTQGLIDRILNPMNYINNFSHLTLGLAKDIRENLEEEEEHINPDNYDDCMDVLDMMQTNLEKIEQHGASTTRILKTMEEMLKERSNRMETVDVALLCGQSIDVLKKYNEDDIARYGISVEWTKPELPIVADVNPELLSKVMLSMLSNSIYAVKKKADAIGNKGEAYKPTVRMDITPKTGEEPPLLSIYDNGIGIEKNIIGKIFDPFFTTKPTSEAPGVGLYLSQQIVQDLGGSISVKSEKNEYTEFIIALP